MRAAPRGYWTGCVRPSEGSAANHWPSGGKLPSCGAGWPSSSTSSGQAAAALGLASSVSASRIAASGSTSVSSWRKKTYSASAARHPMFMALVSPKFLGSRINCACGKSVSRCALPSLEPLSTTMIWSVSRPSDFSRDSRQRRNRAARLRETTTTVTRGGRCSCSGFSGPTGVRGRGTIVVVRLVEARYENGVLLPVDRLGLRPGESVNLIVVRRPVAGRWDLPKLAKAGSAEDVALAEQGLAEWASALETMERS